MKTYTATEIRNAVNAQRRKRMPIVLCSAAEANTALGCQDGGADLLMHYSCSATRRAGLGSMSGCRADVYCHPDNLAAAEELSELAIPVLAGVNIGQEEDWGQSLEQLKAAGYSGVCSFPTAGMCGASLADEDAFYARAAQMDLFTAAFAFDEAEALRAREQNIDLLIFHLGMAPESRHMPLEEAGRRIDGIRAVWGEAPLLIHGGPSIEPEDVAWLMNHSRADGLLSGSTADEKPVFDAAREYVSCLQPKDKPFALGVNSGVLARAAAAAGAAWISLPEPGCCQEIASVAGNLPILAELDGAAGAGKWDLPANEALAGAVLFPDAGQPFPRPLSCRESPAGFMLFDVEEEGGWGIHAGPVPAEVLRRHAARFTARYKKPWTENKNAHS